MRQVFLAMLVGFGCASDMAMLQRTFLEAPTPSGDQPSTTREHDRAAVEVRVERARLERGHDDDADLTVLQFDLVNGAPKAVTDLVLAVTVADGAAPADADDSRRILVGPLTIRSALVLEPGMSVGYEMRLKNLPAGCECVPQVDLQSARAIP